MQLSRVKATINCRDLTVTIVLFISLNRYAVDDPEVKLEVKEVTSGAPGEGDESEGDLQRVTLETLNKYRANVGAGETIGRGGCRREENVVGKNFTPVEHTHAPVSCYLFCQIKITFSGMNCIQCFFKFFHES